MCVCMYVYRYIKNIYRYKKGRRKIFTQDGNQHMLSIYYQEITHGPKKEFLQFSLQKFTQSFCLLPLPTHSLSAKLSP